MAENDSHGKGVLTNYGHQKAVEKCLLPLPADQKQQKMPKKDQENGVLEEPERPIKVVKFLSSVAVIVGVALSWACATQFRKSTMVIDPQHFYAPYALVWFSSCFLLICYPLYNFILCCAKTNVEKVHNEALKVFGASGFSLRVFFFKEILFLFLWLTTNYLYAQSLGYISASAASSIMSANTAVVCILGWILLKEPFSPVKTLAVLIAIAGVVVVSMDSEFVGSPIGVGLVVASAIFAALYKIFFKLLNRTISIGQVSLFMSGLGFLNLTINAVPTILLVYFDLDHIEWSHVPWWPLMGSALLGLVFNFLVNFGILLLDPLVVSIGMLFGIPLSASIDVIFRAMPCSQKFIIGSIMISISFVLIAFPVECGLTNRCLLLLKRRPSAQ